MGYTDFLQEAFSEKTVLVEFDELQELTGDDLWIKELPGNIWKTTYAWTVESRTYVYGSGAWGYGAYGGTETANLPASPREPILKIKSLVIDAEDYILASSYIDMVNTEKTFFWDQAQQILYVHGDDNFSITSSTILLGATQGFSNRSGYYEDLYYEGRVESVPNITKARDVNYYGLISFEGASVSFLNVDGFFDKVKNRGQAIRIYFGGDDLEYSEYEQIFDGYIEDISITGDKFSISIQDTRKLLESSIPNRTILTKFSTAEEDEAGLYLPLAYGEIRDAQAFYTGSGTTFVVADTLYHDIISIDTVYLDGVSITFDSVDLVNGTFSITDGAYTDEKGLITVDFKGYDDGTGTLITDGLTIIQDILENYTQITYSSTYYDQTNWEYWTTILVQELNLFIDDKKDIITVIGEICYAVQGMVDIKGDGRIYFLKQDVTTAAVKDITIDELISQGKVTYDQENYASTVRVGYDKGWSGGKYRRIVDDSLEDELKLEFRKSITKDVDTLLKNKTDAESLAAEFLDYYGDFQLQIQFTTKTQNLDINLEDNINLQTYFYETGDYASLKLEIISIVSDFNNFTTTFIGRFIEVTNGEFDISALIRWNPIQGYSSGSMASSGGTLWRAILPSQGELPTISSSYWEQFAKLYWFDNIQYYVGDIVVHSGIEYRALNDNKDSEPGVGIDWINRAALTNSNLSEGAKLEYNSITQSIDFIFWS